MRRPDKDSKKANPRPEAIWKPPSASAAAAAALASRYIILVDQISKVQLQILFSRINIFENFVSHAVAEQFANGAPLEDKTQAVVGRNIERYRRLMGNKTSLPPATQVHTSN